MKRFGVGFVFVIALSFIVASLTVPPGANAR